MTTEYFNGDLFLAQGIQGFFQGCNAKGVMGKGIAVEFKKNGLECMKNINKNAKKEN